MRVEEKRPEKRIVLLDASCVNQKGEKVLSGVAVVIAPDKTIEVPRKHLPDVMLRRHDRYDAFIKDAQSRPPIRAAIVHPCSPEAILGAVEVRNEGLLDPLLIGPEKKIRAAAEAANVSLDGIISILLNTAMRRLPVLSSLLQPEKHRRSLKAAFIRMNCWKRSSPPALA